MRNPALNAPARTAHPGAPTGTGPPADEDLEGIVRAISRGSHQALAVLLDRTIGTIDAELTARLADPEQRVAILAATYVEVWWLAGCRSNTESDVTDWIRRILDRRVADGHQTAGRQDEHPPRPGRAQRELARLLDRPIDRLWPV